MGIRNGKIGFGSLSILGRFRGREENRSHRELCIAWTHNYSAYALPLSFYVQGTDAAKTVWGVGGGAERSLGPDSVMIATNKATLAGRFLVYDTDYVDATERGTLLLTSPVVTATQGDVWRFDP